MRILISLLIIPLLFSCGNNEKTQSSAKSDTTAEFKPSNYIMSRIGAPDESPYTSLMGLVGIDKVMLEYYSPGANGRQIWGSVVPYDKVWKISDYVPLRFTSTADFLVGDKKVMAGTYFLFLIPKQDSVWKLLFNSEIAKNADQFDSSKTVASLNVKPEKSERFCENLTLSFRKNEVNMARPEIAWEHLRIPFDVKFENNDKVFGRIRQYFDSKRAEKQAIGWDEYMEAAKFCINSNLDPEQGIKWIDSSININTNYNNLQTKAQLFAAQKKYPDAIGYLEQSYELLKKDTAQNKEVGLKTIEAQIQGLKTYVTTSKN